MDPETIRRRIKAARMLAGIDSADELAERLRNGGSERGFGDRTVRKWESGEEPYVSPMVLREIARACGVPPEFFTVDFERLPELDGADAQLTRIETSVDKLLNQYLGDRVDLLRAARAALRAAEEESTRHRRRA